MTTRKKSKAMAYLERLSGGPLTFGKLLRSLRENEEESQTAFASRLGVSKQNLSDIENGRRQVSPERAAEWARILGYSEPQFVRLALQQQLDAAGLRLHVEVRAA